MMQTIRAVIVACALATSMAATAGATTGPAMLGPFGSGNAASFPAMTIGSGGTVYSCTYVYYDFVGVTTGTATIKPALRGCQLFISGSPVADVGIDTPCSWTLSIDHATFDTATGFMAGGTLTTGCVTTVTIPATGCVAHLPAQTVGGLSWQNINASGGNDTSATPWGSKLIQASSGLTFTATGACLGLPEHGTFSVISTVAIHNLFGRL